LDRHSRPHPRQGGFRLQTNFQLTTLVVLVYWLMHHSTLRRVD
jgi:hypothetical protein